ncbi:sensor for unfolded proteins in the ER ire1-like [Daphnia pulex]|uniref:sensor for unfolded proteins in the ER ire1-like n=1 Tax=Daphnia pulex TaxID=6669 RepID=UPI001EDCC3E2|nr:sensor for unfolded proteins in the ER ire1-like [Daphnia pulex]
MELLRLPDKTSHMHENFTRYFCCEKDDNFYYVAIEWCICSVEDLYVRDRKGYDWEGNEIATDLIKASLKKKEILRQATKGVAFLHAMGFVHRNLKPSNFLIARIDRGTRGFKYVVKVSDFRMSKALVTDTGHSGQRGSEGWTSPYPSKHDADNDTHPTTSEINNVTDSIKTIKTHPSEDVFILGCFFHYVLTDGIHPFGSVYNRETNIINKDYLVYKPEWTAPEIKVQSDKTGDQTETAKELQQAVSLIKDMIKFKPEDRPALETILGRA